MDHRSRSVGTKFAGSVYTKSNGYYYSIGYT
jgi:hypothetical protein